MEAALKKADFKSVRGDFRFGNNHFPIQAFYLQDVVKTQGDDFVLKTVATIVKDNQDVPWPVPDEVIRRKTKRRRRMRAAAVCSPERRISTIERAMTPFHRAMPERIAIRPAAVSAGGRIDAGVRHHGPGQSGARLALHDRRLFRRHFRRLDRQLRARRRAGARRHACSSAWRWKLSSCAGCTAATISTTCSALSD